MSNPDRLILLVDTSQTRRAADWLAALGETHDIPPGKLMQLDLCLDEVLMNVIMHSGLDAQSEPIELSFHLETSAQARWAVLTVRDTGKPFDLSAKAPKALAHSLDEAEIGGLGLTIIRNNADCLDYAFEEGRNCLSFGVLL